MVTATLTPKYYRVTFNGTTNVNELTGNQAGGLDSTTAEKYNRIVRLVGTDDEVLVTNLHSIFINNVEVKFTTAGGLDLAGVISTINLSSQEHGVKASIYDTVYLDLQNAPGREGESIWLNTGTGSALTAMGLTAGVRTEWPGVIGTSRASPATLPANTEDIKFNGYAITFTEGSPTVATTCAKINEFSGLTNVRAYAAGAAIQLVSANGQPFSLANGVSGTVADLGLTAGNFGGTPTTLAQSLNKERANMRWEAVVAQLGLLISPIWLGEIEKTGTQDGTAPVTTLAWTVGYDRANYLEIENSAAPGTMLKGADCIKRLVAIALNQDYISNQEVFDPTISTTGVTCARLNPLTIVEVSASSAGSISSLETNNITVVQIPLV
jgi:hypothetical protein